MADDSNTKTEEPEKVEESTSNSDTPTSDGESGEKAGAETSEETVASEQGVDYSMIMETLSAVQANQAKMSAQIQKLSDAQSVMVDAGAVIREGSCDSSSDVTDDKYDGFVSIDELDLNI